MRAAFERALVAPRLGEHRLRQRDMLVLAGVGGAGERNLPVAQAQPVGGAALDERQGLERLDRRARIDRSLDVAEGERDCAIRIDDRARPAMGGFDPPATKDFDHNRVGHGQAPAVGSRE